MKSLVYLTMMNKLTNEISVPDYLNRIGLPGFAEPRLDALKQLQKAHLLTVPFENLDIHAGRAIRLDIQNIFEKVVKRKRGGFCYELNGLFFELLLSLGFQARRISARVFNADRNTYGAEFDHMAILVDIEGKRYLTDVGFGEFSFAPLLLEAGIIQEDERGSFRLDEEMPGYWRVCKANSAGFSNEYIFTEKARALEEFSGMCRYHQTSPDSHFTQQQLITRPTEKGRITLTSDKLKILEKGIVQVRAVEDEADFQNYLKQYFGIE